MLEALYLRSETRKPDNINFPSIALEYVATACKRERKETKDTKIKIFF